MNSSLHRSAPRRRHIAILIVAAVLALESARAQFTYYEDFKDSTADGWVLNPTGNSTPGVVLTSGAAPRSGDPETGATIDPSGSGWLRLTNNTLYLHNAVYFDTPIPSAGNSVTIEFGVNLWGGNNYANTGADGLTFFLYDASKPFQVGADGGSMGYAQKTGVDGLSGGFVAVALDPYGNFSVAGEGRVGGTANLLPNSVSVRGPGEGTSGYNYLAGTSSSAPGNQQGRDYTDTGSPIVLDTGDGIVPALPYNMAFPTATARPNQSTQYRNVSITIDESSQLFVNMQFGEDGLWYNLLDVDLSSFVRPEQLKLGFSAGTGAGTLIAEVGGLLSIEATAGSGNFIWDNRNGPGDGGGGNSVWGTAASDPLNWAGQTNPTLKSNVIFNSAYISSEQSIDITGSDKVITNLYFGGPNAYSLGTTESRKLIFDAVTDNGLTAINLTNDGAGNAAHTIGVDVQMNRNLDINNNITPTFTISGNIDTGGKILGFKGSGRTELTGSIGGTGSLLKSDAGTTVLAGASANTYSGATTINAGVLQIQKASALGSTAVGTTVNAGGTLALAGSGTTFAAEGLTLHGTGAGGGGALLNSSGANTWTGTVALGSAGTNAIGVSGGSLNVSGVISGAAGNNLGKVGPGTLTLSGANTFAGSTTVSGGTLRIGADNNLGTAPGSATPGHLVLDGGALQTTSSFTLAANRGISLGAAGGSLNTDSGTTLTYGGVIAGTSGGSLTKAGTGTLTLTGASTYNGATQIDAGTLRMGTANALPTSTPVTVAGGATFDVNSFNTQIGALAGTGNTTLGTGNTLTVSGSSDSTYAGSISGAGGVTKAGTGTFTLSGANTFTGNLRVDAGTLRLGASDAFANSTTLVLAGGTFSTNGYSDRLGSLSLLASSTLDYNSMGGLLAFGNGTRTAGALTVSNWAGSPTGGGASQLLVDSATAFDATFLSNISFAGYGTGAQIIAVGGGYEVVPVTGASYTWATDANGTWTGNNWNGGVTNPGGIGVTSVFGGAITANRTVTLNANRTSGYLVFNDDNNYTLSGTSTLTMDVSGGSTQINVSGGGSPTLAVPITLNDALAINQNSAGGTLTVSGNITGTNRSITVGGSDNTVISGNIATGSGTLVKNNPGILTLSGTNTYTGSTTINGGTISIGANANLGATPGTATPGHLTLNGGTLRTTGTFTLGANRGVALGAGGGALDTNTGTTLTYNGIIAGTSGGALTKSGAGTLLLGGNNTYDGATNIDAGTLTISAAERLPNATAVSIAGGATLNLNSFSETVGSIAGAGGIALGSPGTATTFTSGGNNASTTFSGVISGGANAALTKTGTGTLTFSGANTYAGNTTVSAGTLNIQHGSALGTTAGRTTVNSGATLELQGGIAVGAEPLFLSGTGAGGNGALRNVSGANSFAGSVTLQADSTIRSESDSLTLSGGVTGTGLALTVTGPGDAILTGTGINTGTGGTLIKTGSGALVVEAAGNYTGLTTVSAGTLEARVASALGTTGTGTTVASGATLVLGGNSYSTAEAMTLAGQGVGGLGALRNVTADHTVSGNITLAAESYVGTAAGTTLTASGVISGTGFGLTKVDSGTLVLSGANTYTGTTAISAGTVELTGAGTLGTAGSPTTISSGATLAFNNLSGTIAENITVAGGGDGNLGALRSLSGANVLSGNITATGNTLIGVSAGSLTASGSISGGYSLVKTGAGSLELAGSANTYTGSTTIRGGTLAVSTNAPVSAGGSLGNSGSTVQIGDSFTATGDNLALLISGSSGGVSIDRAISVNDSNSSGTTTLGGTNTSGTNTFHGNINVSRDILLSSAAGGTVDFSGALSGSGGITATGSGITVLSGNNTNLGAATVSSGATLVAAHGNALGSTAAGTTVNSGGTLGLQGGIALPSGEILTVSGAGAGGVGAINSLSGDNILGGPVTLAGDTTIGAATGNLSLAGVLGESGGSRSLTTTGAGNITFTATNTTSGNLTIGGTGTTTLANSSGQAFGSVSGLVINSGSTLALGAANQINDSVTLTLAGGTFQTGGFNETMRQLTMASSSTIDYLNDGSVLRFDGVNGFSSGLGTLTGTLTIANWAGSLSGSGTEQLVVYSTSGAPTVSAITFQDWGGATTIARSDLGAGFWEIIPTLTGTQWNVDSATTQNWGTAGNWSPAAVPNATNAIAILGDTVGSAPLDNNITISMQTTSRTVGKLIFENSADRNYTIGTGTNGRLDFNVTNGGQAQIIVNDNGSHTLAASSRVNDPLLITNNSGAATGLTISGGLQMQSLNQTLTVNGAGTTLISGAITQSAITGSLLKAGTGTLILSNAANAYTGTTTLREGTLQINANAPSGATGALGNTTSAVVVNDDSTNAGANTALLIGNAGVTVGRALTVGSQGATTTLGGNHTTGNSTFSGGITLNKSVNLTAAGDSNVTFSGQLIDGTGTTNITKSGSGTVTLSNTANNYDGATAINAGTLRLGAANVIPNNSAVSVASGATFDLNSFSETIGSLAGSGSVTGTSGTNTLTTGGNNASTTFSGIISDATGTLALTKTGTGTMTLSGANTYDGLTTVSAGTLIAANNTALGTSNGSTTVTAGASLGLQGSITITDEAMALNTNSSAPSNAALANLSGNNVATGSITLTAANANDAVKIDTAAGSMLTLSGSVGQGANNAVLAKTGTGTLVLSGANSYAGLTNVTAGTLVVANNTALGTTAAGTSVQIGATLGVQNNVNVASGETFTLAGSVVPPSAPSIKNISGTNTLQGAITLTGGINTGVAIDSNSGSLTLEGAITQLTNPNYVIKTGSGELVLGGSTGNAFSGGFTINDGTVIAAKSGGDATGAGSVNIGDGIGTPGSAILRLNASDQVNNVSAVTIRTDGRLDLQSYNDSIGALTMSGGNVQGSGTLTLGNNLTFNGVGSSTASISSNLDLGTAGTRLVQVGNNGITGDTDLIISGAISGSGLLNKTDLGTLELSGSGANTFSGGVTVSDGTLLLNKAAGVSATGTGNVTIGNGIGAADSAKLTLLSSEQIANTAHLVIESDGRLTVSGTITETIGSFAGTGTIEIGSNGLLSVGANGSNSTFAGTLTGSGTLEKTGTGTLTFTDNINFPDGTLTLAGGTLALGTTGAGINLTVETLHITGDTVLDFANSAASFLTATNVYINPGATLTIINWVHLQDYFYANGSFLQFGGGPVAQFDVRGTPPQNQITFDGWSNNDTVWQSWDNQITPAPEPATYGAIMIGGALGFLGFRRLRKRRNAPSTLS